ncbi:MAG TPA: hypothetical protein VFF67_06070 [Thermoplasmata archaeon]|nr:hypothetical protein [Thermoplasmata archaeon]
MPRVAAGFAFVFVAGLALTLLPAAGATPAPPTRLPELPGPAGSAGTAHVFTTQCGVVLTLIAPSRAVVAGQPLHLQASTLRAGGSCPIPTLYSWTLLPGGCTSAPTRALDCTPMMGGVYHPTVIVGFSNGAQLHATAVVVVVSSLS